MSYIILSYTCIQLINCNIAIVTAYALIACDASMNAMAQSAFICERIENLRSSLMETYNLNVYLNVLTIYGNSNANISWIQIIPSDKRVVIYFESILETFHRSNDSSFLLIFRYQ